MTYIGDGAFWYCTSLASIDLPTGITSIGSYAFYSCSALLSITIPAGVAYIGNNAFMECTKLVEVYNLSSLDITAGSTNNGYAGYYAISIYTDENEQSKIVTTNGYIFYVDGDTVYLIGYNGTDTELTLPDDYCNINYKIYNSAFAGCSSLTSVTIPDGVTSIGNYAFCDCTSLTYVTIGSSVTSIGSYAFGVCSALTTVTFATQNGWYISTDSSATSGESVDVTSASDNATNLTSTYCSYYWQRS